MCTCIQITVKFFRASFSWSVSNPYCRGMCTCEKNSYLAVRQLQQVGQENLLAPDAPPRQAITRDAVRAPYNTTSGRDCVESLQRVTLHFCLHGTCPQKRRRLRQAGWGCSRHEHEHQGLLSEHPQHAEHSEHCGNSGFAGVRLKDLICPVAKFRRSHQIEENQLLNKVNRSSECKFCMY